MRHINYTFIIPHHNSPKLLNRCLDSIPQRDDIQIIVVDDNSDGDKKPTINRRSEVEYIFIDENETKGAGRARNKGLQKAKGRWLLFADADDYYNEGFIRILDKYVNSNLDILFFNVSSNDSGINNRALHIQNKYNSFLSDKVSIDIIKYTLWIPWNKMFSSAFIKLNGIQFDEIPVGNDAFFSLKASDNATNIKVIDDCLYCVTYNEQSLTYSKMSFEKEMNYLTINLRINDFLLTKGLNENIIVLLSFRRLFSLLYKYGLRNLYNYLLVIYKSGQLKRQIKLCLCFKK